MERVDLLLVAAEQFEPFSWARESFPATAVGYETDADWNARVPGAFAGGALARFAADEPLSYLYWAYGRATFEAIAAREDPAERTSAVVALDALAMLLRQIDVESRLPARHARFEFGRAPRSRRMSDIAGRAGPWFHRAVLASPRIRAIVEAIAGVMRARQRMNAGLREAHERERPDVPWARSERGSRQTVEGLRLLLLNAWTMFFASRTGRDDLFATLERILSAGADYPRSRLRPQFVAYAGPARDSPTSRAEYAAHGPNMAEKLAHLAARFPDFAESEALDMLAALELVLGPEIEPGVYRWVAGFAQTGTISAREILRAWRGWVASGRVGPVPTPEPPAWTWLRFPRRVPLARADSARPFVDPSFDPDSLNSLRELRPFAIDLRRFRVAQDASRAIDPAVDRSQYRVAALAIVGSVTTPVPVLKPLSSWTFSESGNPSLISTSIEVGGETFEADRDVPAGAWTLVRLTPADEPPF